MRAQRKALGTGHRALGTGHLGSRALLEAPGRLSTVGLSAMTSAQGPVPGVQSFERHEATRPGLRSAKVRRTAVSALVGTLLAAALLAGCSPPPCAEPIPADEDAVAVPEPRWARVQHLVTFEMGPIVESLQGYLILRQPDALRLYGMTESGQKAFDVAWVGSPLAALGPEAEKHVVRFYRAPFLEDDRVLDQIAGAAAQVFLLRPEEGVALEPGEGGLVRRAEGVTWGFGTRGKRLRWLTGPGFSACFMDWRDEPLTAPVRIHFRSERGRYPFELRLKLTKGEALAVAPRDALFRQ